MKICILGHYPSNNERYAGVSRVVYNLAHEMSKISDDVVVLKKKRYAKFFKKEKCGKEKNITICNVSHTGLIYKLIREKYDIINIHNMSSFFVLPLILKRFKLIESKIIFVSHGIVDLEKKEKRYDYPLRYELYQRISIYWSDHIIAVSSYLKKHIQEYYTINGKKISVIGNAVDYHFFQEAKSSTSLYLPKKY
ncbi:MAG: glycosyltransferase family 4 protein, partial [Methanolobus sp.]|uniref:glycosyltransferase family 4 protein n=1 Tax=Methanolobus sp. TaxID=1874737 RepID=UPI002731EABD